MTIKDVEILDRIAIQVTKVLEPLGHEVRVTDVTPTDPQLGYCSPFRFTVWVVETSDTSGNPQPVDDKK
jgi:hypothetical protein